MRRHGPAREQTRPELRLIGTLSNEQHGSEWLGARVACADVCLGARQAEADRSVWVQGRRMGLQALTVIEYASQMRMHARHVGKGYTAGRHRGWEKGTEGPQDGRSEGRERRARATVGVTVAGLCGHVTVAGLPVQHVSMLVLLKAWLTPSNAVITTPRKAAIALGWFLAKCLDAHVRCIKCIVTPRPCVHGWSTWSTFACGVVMVLTQPCQATARATCVVF